ncbi:cobalt ECF transporter T component CbiQ [Marinifilum sp. N1E240]|uniref:cobalt ECF transporter T component CbiQ n=1 Tax=Marinifilum sp. N1E240 TaxID=2608082 RepID=UPI001D04BE13|nr:cobalt ECF transporter T component CbiQ [Marinifilum sp. N1E240]
MQGMEKFILFMLLLNAALLSDQTGLHIFLLASIVLCFLIYGMSLLKMMRLLMLPFGFILLGSISIALSLHANPEISLFCWEGTSICIGVEEEGLQNAIALFCKAMAAVMALNYLILSCPLSEINDIGRKLRIPLILRELFVLTYRYIALLFGFTTQVHIAQRNRLGYASKRKSIASISMLFSSVFVKSLQYSQRNFEALQSRGYTGEFYFNEQSKPVRLNQLIVLILVGVGLLTIHFILNSSFIIHN